MIVSNSDFNLHFPKHFLMHHCQLFNLVVWGLFSYWFLGVLYESEKVKVAQSSDSLRSHGLYSSWNSPGQHTGVGSLSSLPTRGIFPTQGSNSGLMHCRQTLYQLSHKGSPRILEWVAYPFSSGSSWPRNRTGVSCIADGLFTNWAIREAQITREVPVYFCIQRQQSLRFEFR